MPGEPFFAGVSTAVRIESAAARDLQRYAVAARESGVFPNAATFKAAGGVAAWFSPGNVLNGSIGLGMNGPVELEEIVALEAFFQERGAEPIIDVCPMAHPSLVRWLSQRGFVVTGFENVLLRDMSVSPPSVRTSGSLEVIEVGSELLSAWVDLEAYGFTDGEPTEADISISRATSFRDDVDRYIAVSDGTLVGAGLLGIEEGLAHLNGDSTLPEFRGMGAQSAIIAARLERAAVMGCDLAVVETIPGSGSQRNMERAGFNVAYTRVGLGKA